MDIEVGEYVRTNKGIITIAHDGFIERLENGKSAFGKAVKHSKDIIDLIEEGDLIKYKLKNLEHYNYGIVHTTKDPRSLKETLRIGIYKIDSVEILEILTKEQYEANCYR